MVARPPGKASSARNINPAAWRLLRPQFRIARLLRATRRQLVLLTCRLALSAQARCGRQQSGLETADVTFKIPAVARRTARRQVPVASINPSKMAARCLLVSTNFRSTNRTPICGRMRKATPAAADSTTILRAVIPVRMAATGKPRAIPRIVAAPLLASATTAIGLQTMRSQTTHAALA